MNSTPELATDPPVSETARIAKAAGIISLGNVFSRVMGLVREIVKSNFFGAGGAVSAFNVATSVPVMISDLLVNGMVSSALVPVFSEYAETRREELWNLVAALLNLVTIVLAIFIIAAEMLSPQIAYLMNSGASPELLDLTASLLRITIPAVLFLNSATVLSGLLYAFKRFTLPAFMAAAYNTVIVIITLLFSEQLGITAMAVGLLSGAAMQFFLLLPGLRGLGLKFSLRLWHPGLKKIVLLYLPIALGVSVDVLISRPLSYSLASQTGDSSISWMNYATYLMQLPQGLVATAISFAILPTLSGRAVLARADRDHSAFNDTLSRGLKLVIFLIIPAAVGLYLLSTPVIELIYEHGVFLPVDTSMTSLALRLYLIGLPFAAIDLLLVFAFYALQDTLTPSLIGVGTIVFYLVVAFILLPTFGLFSLMIADSLKHLLHMTISAILLRKKLGDSMRIPLVTTLARVLIAVFVMGLSVWGTAELLQTTLSLPENMLGEALLVLFPAFAGVAVYIGMSLLLKIDEMALLWEMLRKKLGRR